MARKNYIAAIGFLTLVVLLTIWVTHYVNRAPETVDSDTLVEIKISSKDLLAEFLEDEAKANENYVEKVIEVAGTVKEVTFLNNRYTVLLQGQGEYACLICDMDSGMVEEIQSIAKGDSIKLKGVCKGFLMDAILLNCVLIAN